MKNYRYVLFLAFIILCHKSMAQYDDVEEPDYRVQFQQGLFITFDDFKQNKAIAEKFIETNFNPIERNFYYNLLKEPRVNINSPDSIFSIKPASIWGYFDGKWLFINRKVFQLNVLQAKDRSDHLWAQVLDIGTICLIYYNKNFKPELSLWTVGKRKKHNKEYIFLLDTRDGLHYAATSKNLEFLIKDETEIYNEFKNYKGDSDEKLYIFLKRYNQKHKLETSKSKS